PPLGASLDRGEGSGDPRPPGGGARALGDRMGRLAHALARRPRNVAALVRAPRERPAPGRGGGGRRLPPHRLGRRTRPLSAGGRGGGGGGLPAPGRGGGPRRVPAGGGGAPMTTRRGSPRGGKSPPARRGTPPPMAFFDRGWPEAGTARFGLALDALGITIEG